MAVVVDCRWSEAGKREEKMCVPCKLDSEGKVLKTDKCTLNGLLLSVLVACSSICWFGSLFYNHTSSLWSVLSHYPVDVFYLLVQHCQGRQLSLNIEAQSLG